MPRSQASAVVITATDIPWGIPDESSGAIRLDAVDDIVDLVLDAESYRLLTQRALCALHHQGLELERLRHAHERLRDEYRELHVRVLRDAGATV